MDNNSKGILIGVTTILGASLATAIGFAINEHTDAKITRQLREFGFDNDLDYASFALSEISQQKIKQTEEVNKQLGDLSNKLYAWGKVVRGQAFAKWKE